MDLRDEAKGNGHGICRGCELWTEEDRWPEECLGVCMVLHRDDNDVLGVHCVKGREEGESKASISRAGEEKD